MEDICLSFDDYGGQMISSTCSAHNQRQWTSEQKPKIAFVTVIPATSINMFGCIQGYENGSNFYFLAASTETWFFYASVKC